MTFKPRFTDFFDCFAVYLFATAFWRCPCSAIKKTVRNEKVLPFNSLIHLIHCISHLRTVTWPELDQMPLNNYYSVILLLLAYQFFLFAARGLGSNFLPPQGDGLYFSYTGDSNSPQPFHPLHFMSHPPQSLARLCDSRTSSYVIFVQIISQKKRRNRNSRQES